MWKIKIVFPQTERFGDFEPKNEEFWYTVKENVNKKR